MSQSSSHIVLACVLKVMRPLARLLLKNGVTYTAFAQALKPVFLQAAQDELNRLGRPTTDSAASLLSGVHRRDVRNLTRLAPAVDQAAAREPLSLVTQVVARWLSEPALLYADGKARTLERGAAADGFDQLVTKVSSDVRPRAVLDELLRLGAVEETLEGIRMLDRVFTPRQGQEEMARLFADNLHDHLAAAGKNLQGEANFLEQSIFVDQLTAESAARLGKVSNPAMRFRYRLVSMAGLPELRKRGSRQPSKPARMQTRWASTTRRPVAAARRTSGQDRSLPARRRQDAFLPSMGQRTWCSPSRMKGNTHPWRGTWGSPFGMLRPVRAERLCGSTRWRAVNVVGPRAERHTQPFARLNRTEARRLQGR